jgi:hypothetical protein
MSVILNIGDEIEINGHGYVITRTEVSLDYEGRSIRINAMDPICALRFRQDQEHRRKIMENAIRIVPKMEKALEDGM